MLKARNVEFTYREYTERPLSAAEIRAVLSALGVGPRDVLRRNDAAYGAAGVTGAETDSQLVALMARYPTLLQRPIGIAGDRAVLGRPPERLLELVGAGGPAPRTARAKPGRAKRAASGQAVRSKRGGKERPAATPAARSSAASVKKTRTRRARGARAPGGGKRH